MKGRALLLDAYAVHVPFPTHYIFPKRITADITNIQDAMSTNGTNDTNRGEGQLENLGSGQRDKTSLRVKPHSHQKGSTLREGHGGPEKMVLFSKGSPVKIGTENITNQQ